MTESVGSAGTREGNFGSPAGSRLALTNLEGKERVGWRSLS